MLIAVEDDWKVLEEAGVPVGAVRRPGSATPDVGALRAAVLSAADSADAEGAQALTAWLSVFRHHFPARFMRTLGPEVDRLTDVLRQRITDPSRYLKLRRIALENLSRTA
jgi:hypothetical protein